MTVKNLKSENSLLLPLWIISLILLGYLMHVEATIFVWVFCSVLLYILIDPWYLKLKRKGFSSQLAAVIVVLISTLIIGIILALFIYFSNDAYTELETSKKIFIDYYNQLNTQFKEWMSGFTMNTTNTMKDLATGKTVQKVQVVDNSAISGGMSDKIITGVGSVMSILVYVILWPILTFFILSEREAISKKFMQLFSSEEKAIETWRKITSATKAYFFGNLIILLVTIPIFLVLFLVFSVQNFFTLAVLAAVMNIIPFVGGVLTGLLPALQILGQSNDVLSATWIYLLCLSIHFMLANFITPKLLGSKVNLNATTSTIALIAWSHFWGGMGLILAIPATAIIKILFENSDHFTLVWISNLMSEKDKA